METIIIREEKLSTRGQMRATHRISTLYHSWVCANIRVWKILWYPYSLYVQVRDLRREEMQVWGQERELWSGGQGIEITTITMRKRPVKKKKLMSIHGPSLTWNLKRAQEDFCDLEEIIGHRISDTRLYNGIHWLEKTLY